MELTSRPSLLNLGSRPGFSVWGRKRSRDPALRLRPGLESVRSQFGLKVATWPRLLGHLVSRPGHYSCYCLDNVHGHCSRILFIRKKKK